jgi:uncharacterized membrane protein YhaH (DUF805 family)
MDFVDKVVQNVYVWGGRIGRVDYFMYGLVSSMVTVALLALINPLLDFDGSLWVVISLGLLIAAIGHSVYTSLNLVSKRLCDMGYDFVHIWWIFGLWLITTIHSWGEPESTITYCLLAADVLVSLWLLFSPGKKDA